MTIRIPALSLVALMAVSCASSSKTRSPVETVSLAETSAKKTESLLLKTEKEIAEFAKNVRTLSKEAGEEAIRDKGRFQSVLERLDFALSRAKLEIDEMAFSNRESWKAISGKVTKAVEAGANE